jgi:hypothetical protein
MDKVINAYAPSGFQYILLCENHLSLLNVPSYPPT